MHREKTIQLAIEAVRLMFRAARNIVVAEDAFERACGRERPPNSRQTTPDTDKTQEGQNARGADSD